MFVFFALTSIQLSEGSLEGESASPGKPSTYHLGAGAGAGHLLRSFTWISGNFLEFRVLSLSISFLWSFSKNLSMSSPESAELLLSGIWLWCYCTGRDRVHRVHTLNISWPRVQSTCMHTSRVYMIHWVKIVTILVCIRENTEKNLWNVHFIPWEMFIIYNLINVC